MAVVTRFNPNLIANGEFMKKQVAKTITTLSLFIALSVSASNVFAFPGGCGTCKPSVSYAATAPGQTANLAAVQNVSPVLGQDTAFAQTQSESAVGFVALFWTRLAVFFASLF